MGGKVSKASRGSGTILKGSGSTTSFSVHLHDGAKGVCQDNVVAVESFLPDYRAAVMGVFDGHGQSGHHVSAFVRERLVETLKSSLKEIETKPRTSGAWSAMLNSVFSSVDDEVQTNKELSADASGSTAVMALRKGDILVLAHVGDSRCVLARSETVNGSTGEYRIIPLQLTRDHKAGDPGEKARVQKAGGHVIKWMNTVDRVFVPGKNEPGLAVARAFGDFDLKGHGLIANPEVKIHDIEPRDQFVVLGSDGIWDVLSNEEVVQIVFNCKVKGKAAKEVAMKAAEAWSHHRSPNARDDISVVVYYF